MKVIYHNDADGHCAAAIVWNECHGIFEPILPKDLIEYDHEGKIEIDDESIREGEQVYIVDLALDEAIFEVIKQFIKHNCKIVHIDHHISGRAYYNNMDAIYKTAYNKNVISYYRTDVSASMLTWVYVNMTETERLHPNDVPIDFTEEFTHIGFYPETNAMRECFIPKAVRYIDDNDVWRHQFEESKYFALAYQIEDNDPLNTALWGELLYDNRLTKTYKMIETGKLLHRYQEAMYAQACGNGHIVHIDGHTGYAVNCPVGNSRLFGDKYDEYDFVVKYHYDGSIKRWKYTFYSKDDSTFDCAAICRKHFAGGGHKHAAGGTCITDYFRYTL